MAGAYRPYRVRGGLLTALAPLIDLPARLRPALPFAAVGTACVIAGGLVAAATAPAPSEHGSWAAAYLVLVAGVTQVALAAGQALLAPASPSRRTLVGELVGWNAGNGAVLAGTLTGVTPVVDAGGILLVVGLALWIAGIRGVSRRSGWGPRLYRLLVGVMLVSIPVGLLLAQARG